MKDKQTVWVVEGKSESGDEWVAVFSRKPTGYTKKKLAFQWDGDIDDPTGSGYEGSYVNITVFARVVDED